MMAPCSLPILEFPERKSIRARVIWDYVSDADYGGKVVCFSCGNAARALRHVGLDVLEIGPNGFLLPGGWWRPAHIRRIWPDRFDATSGHLPLPLHLEVARAFKSWLDREFPGGFPEREYAVPTGSGETILALSWVYPEIIFHPLYGVHPATVRESDAPLNPLVDNLLIDRRRFTAVERT